jgi:hypothetical protein
MDLKEDLRPTSKPRLIDLVQAAGVDVSPWAMTSKGVFANPAANPRYCYDWSFIQECKVVVLNLWYEEIEQRGTLICRELNLREWSAKRRKSLTLEPGAKSLASRRSKSMEAAVAHAFVEELPVRIIVVDGPRRDYSDPSSLRASSVKCRRLDPSNWWVQSYEPRTGACLIIRGERVRFVDQFSSSLEDVPKRIAVQGTVWKRDPQVREAVLLRARGVCEFCGCRGFATADCGIYLETHHVIPLSEGGPDNVRNVVAICANDHREAHHGERQEQIRMQLCAFLSAHYGLSN